jgi:hypothetical protein
MNQQSEAPSDTIAASLNSTSTSLNPRHAADEVYAVIEHVVPRGCDIQWPELERPAITRYDVDRANAGGPAVSVDRLSWKVGCRRKLFGEPQHVSDVELLSCQATQTAIFDANGHAQGCEIVSIALTGYAYNCYEVDDVALEVSVMAEGFEFPCP